MPWGGANVVASFGVVIGGGAWVSVLVGDEVRTAADVGDGLAVL